MTDNYDPYSAAPIGHNRPPLTAYETIKQEIEDLFDEAKNWADGEAIDSQAIADAITELHDKLHEAGKRADEARKDEAKPHDDAKAEIQDRFNKLIGNTKSVKGKVVLGKGTLQALLTPWRNKLVAEKEAAARAAREEADRIAAEAQEAMRASAGNLEEREKAEGLLAEAKKADRWAKREDRSATSGTGLRTIWRCTLEDEGKALDWAYGRAPERFKELVQSMAEETVRAGMRQVPGFRVWDESGTVMGDKSWKWYSGDNDENYSYGPFDTRDEAIEEARGGYGDDVGIFVIAAIKGEIRLRDYIGASHILEEAEDSAYDLRGEGDNNIFDVTKEQEKDLAVMLKTACDAWQIKHGLTFTPWVFTNSHNEEYIGPEAA